MNRMNLTGFSRALLAVMAMGLLLTACSFARAEVAAAPKTPPVKAAPVADAESHEAKPGEENGPAAARITIEAYAGDVDPDHPLYEGDAALDDQSLKDRLSLALARPEMDGVKVGLHVIGAHDGKVLIDINGGESMNPASNQKLLTTAVALKRLGPGYTFKTRFLAKAPIGMDGVLNGSLYIAGGGDPWLVIEQLYKIGAELYARGLRKIKGDIIIDDGFFDQLREPPGWEQDDTDNAYQAPTGALSANFNAVSVYVAPGEAGKAAKVTVLPMTRYISVENSAVTVERRRTRLTVHSLKDKDKNKVSVEGRINTKANRRVFHLKIDNPPLFAGWAIHDALKQIGIKTTGYVKIGCAPDDLEEIHTFHSPPLSRLAAYINKYSNNHMAEQTLKTIGAEIGESGSLEEGLAVLREFIEGELGYPADAYTVRNGSGLGDVNSVSPELLTRVLAYMDNDRRLGPDYLATMAVAGRDGTLSSLFTGDNVTEMFRGKTGSLEQVIALSGYLVTAGERRLAVSLIFNECRGHEWRRLKEIQQEIIRILASWDPGETEGTAR